MDDPNYEKLKDDANELKEKVVKLQEVLCLECVNEEKACKSCVDCDLIKFKSEKLEDDLKELNINFKDHIEDNGNVEKWVNESILTALNGVMDNKVEVKSLREALSDCSKCEDYKQTLNGCLNITSPKELCFKPKSEKAPPPPPLMDKPEWRACKQPAPPSSFEKNYTVDYSNCAPDSHGNMWGLPTFKTREKKPTCYYCGKEIDDSNPAMVAKHINECKVEHIHKIHPFTGKCDCGFELPKNAIITAPKEENVIEPKTGEDFELCFECSDLSCNGHCSYYPEFREKNCTRRKEWIKREEIAQKLHVYFSQSPDIQKRCDVFCKSELGVDLFEVITKKNLT